MKVSRCETFITLITYMCCFNFFPTFRWISYFGYCLHLIENCLALKLLSREYYKMILNSHLPLIDEFIWKRKFKKRKNNISHQNWQWWAFLWKSQQDGTWSDVGKSIFWDGHSIGGSREKLRVTVCSSLPLWQPFHSSHFCNVFSYAVAEGRDIWSTSGPVGYIGQIDFQSLLSSPPFWPL